MNYKLLNEVFKKFFLEDAIYRLLICALVICRLLVVLQKSKILADVIYWAPQTIHFEVE